MSCPWALLGRRWRAVLRAHLQCGRPRAGRASPAATSAKPAAEPAAKPAAEPAAAPPQLQPFKAKTSLKLAKLLVTFESGGGDLKKAFNVPPSFVVLQRINLGLMSLFGQLRATRNWRRIAEELWPFVAGPPSTPMGEDIATWERAGRSSTR